MRVVVRCSNVGQALKAQAALEAAGCESVALPSEAASARQAPGGEDVTLIAALEGGPEEAAGYARALSKSDERLALIAGVRADTCLASGLGKINAFDGVVALDAPPTLLSRQIQAVLRARSAQDELQRRRETATAFGAKLPPPPKARPLKALYVGAPSPQFLELERALAPFSGFVAAAFTSFTGFDYLHDEAFDAVVLNGCEDPGKAIALCAALRRNAQLHSMPTMVITSPHDSATGKACIERGASVVTRADAPSAPAMGWLFEAVRSERARRSAEHGLAQTRDVLGDPRTGLFRADSFKAHLDHLAEAHHMSGRPLGLAALRVMVAHGAREPSGDAWRAGFQEIASLAGRLVRDTDSAATIGSDQILLALPATRLAEARRTAERVASVAECTSFASGEGDVGPLVFEQIVIELQPGESGRGLLSRALSQFDAEAVPA